MNVATFMSLVWVLFGSECYYYKGLQNVYATLELREVMAQKQSFTAEHCRRITWAILDDGRAHFDDVKTTLDCHFWKEGGHPLPADTMNEVVDQVTDVIGKGLIKPMPQMGTGSPPKKQKVGEAGMQN